MPLESIAEMMADARRNGYAVGYFESWDLPSLEGVIDAAEQSRAPVIVGFNGEFLSHAQRVAPARLEWYAALGRAAAESARVPCALMFNECAADAWVERATELGFGLVMLADENAAPADLTRRVAELVRVAHARGVAVEAELGTLPCGAPKREKGTGPICAQHPSGRSGKWDQSPFPAGAAGSLTDPEQAAAFVQETGIDLLAVSAGNVHILLNGQLALDLAHLAAIRRKVDIPLVLHGGSGIAPGSLAEAISLGVAKVNYGTYLKQRYLAGIRRALDHDDTNPHHRLGYGGDADLLVVARQAVRDAVLERIGMLGCCGKG